MMRHLYTSELFTLEKFDRHLAAVFRFECDSKCAFCFLFVYIPYLLCCIFFIIIIIMYLYSAQYLHIVQDSKRYLTNLTVQVQPQLTSN